MARRSVLIGSSASAANGATASSIIRGSINGSSPWTLTTRSHSSDCGDFRQPVGSRAVVGPRHPSLAAKRVHGLSDALVVGGNDDGVDAFGTPRRAAIDVLDHRPARNRASGFPGKRDDA